MNDASTVTSQPCGTCPGGHYEVTIPAGLDAGQVMQALYDAGDAHRMTHESYPSHIRRQAASKRGNGFYAPKYGTNENGSKTLCGALAGNDIAWGDARFDKHLAYVTCEDCKRRRAAGEGRAR